MLLPIKYDGHGFVAAIVNTSSGLNSNDKKTSIYEIHCHGFVTEIGYSGLKLLHLSKFDINESQKN